MKVICSCLQCKKEFSAKGIFTHVDRTHLRLSKYSSGNNGKYKEISEKANIKKQNEENLYLLSPKCCTECSSILPFLKKENRFCSKSCSAKQTNRLRVEKGWSPSIEHRKKTSKKLTGRTYAEPVVIFQKCLCGSEFSYVRRGNKNRKYCNNICANKYSSFHIKKREIVRANRSALINYRADCAFKFSLNDYPREFDFTLVETYGWYKAKNRGDNLSGVSRDHMVSVRWAFDNNIPAEHISHPANCQLIQHGKNSSKGTSNSISYQELLERIKHWDEKYKR